MKSLLDILTNKKSTNESSKSSARSSANSNNLIIDIIHDAENCPLRKTTNCSELYDLVIKEIVTKTSPDFDHIKLSNLLKINWRIILPFSNESNSNVSFQAFREGICDLQSKGAVHINPGEKHEAAQKCIKNMLDDYCLIHEEDSDTKKSRRLIVLISGNKIFRKTIQNLLQHHINVLLIHHDPADSTYKDLLPETKSWGLWQSFIDRVDNKTVPSVSPPTVINNDTINFKKQQSRLLFQDDVRRSKNSFTSSIYFEKLCTQMFHLVDTDKSNSVDLKEMYIATLLLYLKLSVFVVGLTPPTEKHFIDIMEVYGYTKTDTLDLKSFIAFSSLLLKDIVTRVTLQAIFILFVVPFISSKLLNIFCFYFNFICSKLPSALLLTFFSMSVVMSLTPYLISAIESLFVPKNKLKQL